MYKYFDNILFFLQKSGGGSVYWGELMKRFNDRSDVKFISPQQETANIVLQQLNLQNVLREKRIPLKFLRYLPMTLEIENESIFHSSYYRYSNQESIKNVVTVHDFIYEYYSPKLPRLVHHYQKGMAVKKAKGIICISESTKLDLLRFFPDQIKGKQIEVIYNGVSNDFFEITDEEYLHKKYPSLFLNRYVLFVGHRTHYKNFDFCVEVVKSLPPKYKLLIVGNPLSDIELVSLNKNIPNQFNFMGNVTNSELNEIYNISHCLIYPSSYEGFGIPLIEAFRSGCPVVAQDISVLKEISGEAATLIHGLDLNKFKEAIMALASETERLNKITMGLAKARAYSWDKCFLEVSQFYNILK